MRFTRLFVQNWRNFLRVEVDLRDRMFLVGPNASGKSNLLDAFRFLRDVAEPQGGFQKAVLESRGGVSRLRSLHARRVTDVIIEVSADVDGTPWRYRLAFKQDNVRRPVVTEERVWRGDDAILQRPDKGDESDPGRLAQTHLEQVNANKEFRELAEFFARVRYLHIVPQLIREPERYKGKNGGPDPYGSDFLEYLARQQREQKRTFESRLRRINEALRVAVPQLKDLRLERDEVGRPHLQGLYEHWRPDAGWQREDQFSDGTLRLFGLLWSLVDGSGPLLLEEPELSLHEAIIRHSRSGGGALRRQRREARASPAYGPSWRDCDARQRADRGRSDRVVVIGRYADADARRDVSPVALLLAMGVWHSRRRAAPVPAGRRSLPRPPWGHLPGRILRRSPAREQLLGGAMRASREAPRPSPLRRR